MVSNRNIFFLSVVSEFIDDFTTDSLSTHTFALSGIGTPIIRNLYCKLIIFSTVILNATNSEPNVDISTVFCRFENQEMGAMFTKIKIPV